MPRFKTYLPRITGEGPTAQHEPSKPNEYVLTLQEKELFSLAENDPGQKRGKIVMDLPLCKVARSRAMDMATRGYFGHNDPDGKTPNEVARAAGIALPSHYAQKGNNIESIAGGYPTPQTCWEGWLKSPSHRVHVLGESGFYAEQKRIGIGYWRNDDALLIHYWVFLSIP